MLSVHSAIRSKSRGQEFLSVAGCVSLSPHAIIRQHNFRDDVMVETVCFLKCMTSYRFLFEIITKLSILQLKSFTCFSIPSYLVLTKTTILT